MAEVGNAMVNLWAMFFGVDSLGRVEGEGQVDRERDGTQVRPSPS
jgi:hypothetical protein